MKEIKYIVIISISLFLSGCITTEVRSYTDNKYKSYKIKSVAILAISRDIGLSLYIEKGLYKRFSFAKVKAVMSRDVLPPTRAYSDEEIKKAFLTRGIESLIIVHVGYSAQSSQVIGTQTFGNAYTTASGSAYSVGNTVYGSASASTTRSTSSFSIIRRKRKTIAKTKLYDIASGMIVWVAQSETNARGLIFMSDSATSDDLDSKIIKSLSEKGHLPQNKGS